MATQKKKKRLVRKTKPAPKRKKTLKKKKVIQAKRKTAKKRKAISAKRRPLPSAAVKVQPAAVKAAPKPEAMVEIGKISHYFPHVKAGVLKLVSGPLNIGDKVYIKGHTTDFTETVTSMQANHNPITTANAGDEIGFLVNDRVRVGDTVYKI